MTRAEAEDLLVDFLAREHGWPEGDARGLVARFPDVAARLILAGNRSSYAVGPMAVALEMLGTREGGTP